MLQHHRPRKTVIAVGTTGARTAAALAACRHGGSASAGGDAVVASCTFEISGDPSEVKLLPAGGFSARDGRPGNPQ